MPALVGSIGGVLGGFGSKTARLWHIEGVISWFEVRSLNKLLALDA